MTSFTDREQNETGAPVQGTTESRESRPTVPFQRPETRATESQPGLQDDALLQLVIDRWASLPEAVRQAIFDTVFERA